MCIRFRYRVTITPSVQLLNVSNGPLLAQDGQTVALVNRDDSMAGILQLTARGRRAPA